jgi:hypothetical protein
MVSTQQNIHFQTGSREELVLTGACSDLRWYASPAFDLYGFPQWWHFRVNFSSSAAPLPHFLTWYIYPIMLVKVLEQLWTQERGLHENLTSFYMIPKFLRSQKHLPHKLQKETGTTEPSKIFPTGKPFLLPHYSIYEPYESISLVSIWGTTTMYLLWVRASFLVCDSTPPQYQIASNIKVHHWGYGDPLHHTKEKMAKKPLWTNRKVKKKFLEMRKKVKNY